MCVIYAIYSRISQDKKVFNPANAIQRYSKQNYHCTNNKFWKFQNLNDMVVVRQRLNSLCSITMT